MNKQSFSTNKKGFTLIELMVAVSIVAILAAIGLTSYYNSQKAARDAKRISDIQEVQKALEQYYAINGGYPAVAAGSGSVAVSALTAVSSNSYFPSGTPPSDPNKAEVGNYEYTYYSCGGSSVAPLSNATQYIVCAQLVNAGGKGNMSAVPGDGCATLGNPASGNNYFCAKSLSN